MDMSSEMIHALLPTFLVVGLGASPVILGVIEGVADGTASFAKLLSGWLSDRLGTRKWLAGLGYALAAVSKPFFALATSAGWVLGARFVDRLGKGIRGAPRDALIADLTPPEQHGAAYGLRQALDSAGAVIGPLAASALMLLLDENMRAIFWIAVIPAAISVSLIVVKVSEPRGLRANPQARIPLRRKDIARLGTAFWRVVALAGLLLLARFSEAFLLLRGQETGVPAAYLPLLFVLMNSVFALAAFPAGALSDRIGRRRLLLAGFVLLAAAELLLAVPGSAVALVAATLLWGLHLALTQGLLVALVADTAAPELRGTAFGILHLVAGVSLLLASTLAGALWSLFGAAIAVTAAASLALAGVAAASLWLPARG
ncbi:MAG: MFS transporter [Alphaproteobacteria bacterium]|nr:MAG: MFS transporter [Alphaproteobacteria bacterium]